MAFPIQITSVLTGATVAQLRRWRRGVLAPEVSTSPFLYSFRDLVALRTVVKLRSDLSLQAVRKALERLRDLDLTQHPSAYTLQTNGSSVYLIEADARLTWSESQDSVSFSLSKTCSVPSGTSGESRWSTSGGLARTCG